VTETIYALDASAVLCAFFDEPGADVVAARMNGALLSAVSYHEIVAKLVDRQLPPHDIRLIMSQLDVEVVPVDRRQAEIAGLLRAHTRDAGLSLGDRACLALAFDRKATALTADKAWAGLELELELEDIAVELVR